MNEYMKNIWCWYLERSPWIKWALFIFVVLAITILGVISFFFAGKSVSGPRHEPEKILKEKLEEKYVEDLKETTRMDSELAKKILGEEEKRKEIAIKKKKILEEANRVYKKIDDSPDFRSVDDAINEYIKGTARGRKRKS